MTPECYAHNIHMKFQEYGCYAELLELHNLKVQILLSFCFSQVLS